MMEENIDVLTDVSTSHSGGMVKWKVSHSKEEADRYSTSPFYRSLRPIIWSLRLFGLHHIKYFTDNKSACTISYFSLVYSIIILIILWLNVIRLLTIFNKNDSFGPGLFLKIILVGWMLLCAINASCCFQSCRNKNGLPQFFLQWASLNPGGLSQANCHYISQRVLMYCLVCWLLLSLNLAFSGYMFISTDMFDDLSTPIKLEGNGELPVRILYIACLQFILCGSWIMPVGLFAVICTIIVREFQEMKSTFCSQVNECGHFSGDLADIRYRHQAITRMVSYADNVLKVIIANVICLNTITVCLMFYNIIYYDVVLQDSMVLFIHIFWAVTCLVNLSAIAIGPAFVNTQVRSILDQKGVLYILAKIIRKL